jgi:hypothetical protein
MNPEWLYYFLQGTNQFGAPCIVVFCYNTIHDIVEVYPYIRIHPSSMPDADVPIKPTEIGHLLKEQNTLTATVARGLWVELCQNSKYRMQRTSFEELYPGKKYSKPVVSMDANNFYADILVGRFLKNANKRVYEQFESHNTNYALEA